MVELANNEIHIWSISQKVQKKRLKVFWQFLSKEERERANCFLVEIAKNEYIISRGVLRELLALYLKMSINELKLAYNRFGKPYLKNRRFYFNISHAHGITLCAFSRDREVGIDVEFMHAGINFLEIAERFFSDNEYKELCNVSTKDRLGAFYQCWTQKEAYIKAIGKGFRTPLDSFSVPIQNKLTLLQTKNLSEIDYWTLSPIHLIYKKHVAALAYNGINCQIRIFKYGTKLNKEIRGY